MIHEGPTDKNRRHCGVITAFFEGGNCRAICGVLMDDSGLLVNFERFMLLKGPGSPLSRIGSTGTWHENISAIPFFAIRYGAFLSRSIIEFDNTIEKTE